MNDMTKMPGVGLTEAAELALVNVGQPSLAAIWITFIFLLVDVPILTLSLWFAQYTVVPTEGFKPFSAGLAASAAALVTVVILSATSSYTSRVLVSAWRALLRLATALALPIGLLALVLPADPLAFLLAAILCLAVATIPQRLAAAIIMGWICKMRLLDRRAVIAGGGEHAQALIRGLARSPGNDIRIFGIFDDRDDVRSPPQVLGVPKLGTYEDLIAFARRCEIDMVIIALPLAVEDRIAWLLDSFRVLPVEVRLSAFSQDFTFAKVRKPPLISAIQHSFSPECRLAKRVFDVLIALIALMPAAPMMLLAAVAIRLESPGPVFFRQRRHGYNDRIFEILKFRSMYHEASDPEARSIVTRGDPRVTRVGRFLRRTSIDELPQLFNVLRGNLSLVGPRPHAVDAVSSQSERFAHIVDGYSARHRLPPGITGWAQIHGWRGEIDEHVKLTSRFEHDLYYIENWSIWLDIRILLRTPLSLVRCRSAY